MSRMTGPQLSARTLGWFAVLTAATAAVVGSQLGGQWTMGGQSPSNARSQSDETRIGVSNVGALSAKWTLNTDGDVSATPAVKDGAVYVPDWSGNVYAVDTDTGAVIWKTVVSGVTGVPATDGQGGPGGIVRTTPAVAGNLLIMGDQGGRAGRGAKVFALDRKTGATRWVTQIQGDGQYPLGDDFAIVTQSPVVDENNPNVVYVGTASWEEALAAFIPGYQCCSFRGAVFALDVRTGQILWQTYMAPEGYSGNGVWGGTGAIDAKRKTLYVTTGNNYSVPQAVLDCVAAAVDDAEKMACMDASNFFDSIVALDTQTGAVRWATKALPYDTWNVNCLDLGFPTAGTCPDPAGPDYDFGQGPTLFSARLGGRTRDLVGAGQKSGKYWTLDRQTGQVVWATQVGPGGTMGGLQWGSAVDDNRIYVAVNNSGAASWTLLDGTTTTAGAWSALDKATGQILWQTVTPDSFFPGFGSAIGAVTVANGVAYACTFAGSRVAMSASSGDILWTDPPTGELCGAGAAVSRGTVYWGNGYGQIAFAPVTNGTLTAYSVP
ncbi:MAG: PQQ-binding-like beta-propeller repeat protein [Acidobacteriota bacterium]|nr:PQQ-binding-like beta-propeller repeat protein [Acidobacteriota bacterium]